MKTYRIYKKGFGAETKAMSCKEAFDNYQKSLFLPYKDNKFLGHLPIEILITNILVIECIENERVVYSGIFDNNFNQLKWSDYVY